MLQEHELPAVAKTPGQQGDLSQPTMTETISLSAGDSSFVSPRELAHLLRVTTDCIYRLVAKRTLPVYRVLRRILFRRSDVEHWLSSHRTEVRDTDLWQSEK